MTTTTQLLHLTKWLTTRPDAQELRLLRQRVIATGTPIADKRWAALQRSYAPATCYKCAKPAAYVVFGQGSCTEHLIGMPMNRRRNRLNNRRPQRGCVDNMYTPKLISGTISADQAYRMTHGKK